MVKTIKIKNTKNLKKSVTRTVPVFDLSGNKIKDVKLPEIFQQKFNQELIAQAARVYESKLHQGTQSTKTRGEVAGSTRKIYRQKGTGRARHGSIKAPVFVGGGIVFGPKPRNFKFELPVKMRQLALAGLLSKKYADDKIIVVEGFNKASGKTAEIAGLIKKTNLTDKKVLLVMTNEMKTAVKAGRNITNILIRPAQTLSFLDVIKNEIIIFAHEAVNKINQKGFKK